MCFYRRRDLPNPLVQLADKHQSKYNIYYFVCFVLPGLCRSIQFRWFICDIVCRSTLFILTYTYTFTYKLYLLHMLSYNIIRNHIYTYIEKEYIYNNTLLWLWLCIYTFIHIWMDWWWIYSNTPRRVSVVYYVRARSTFAKCLIKLILLHLTGISLTCY